MTTIKKPTKKKTAEVMVAYTYPEVFKVVENRGKKYGIGGIANQKDDKRDAKYIAFLITQHKDRNRKGYIIPSEITHYAKVKSIEERVKTNWSYFKREMPEILEIVCKKGWAKRSGYNKEYKLQKLIKKKIIHRNPKEHAKGQVVFYTTLDKLKNAKYIDEL